MNVYGLETGHIDSLILGENDEENRVQWDALSEARHSFVFEGIMPKPSAWLHADIIDSWARCKEMGVDPESTDLAIPLSSDDFQIVQDEYAELVEAAKPLIGIIDDLDLNNDYIFELISRNGVTVLRTGNMDLHSIVRKCSIMNEPVMGTNAHTLCMKYGKPYILLGPEHYCSALTNLAAIACPVYNKHGIVVASLLLTQPLPEKPWSVEYRKLLSHALGFITSISSALENQMVFQDSLVMIADADEKLEQARTSATHTRHVLDTAIGSSGDPILIMDSNGIVQHASPEAVHLLRTTMDGVVGRSAESLFGLEWPRAFEPLMQSTGVEITAQVGPKLVGIRGNAVRGAAGTEVEGFIARISGVHEPKSRTSGNSGEVAAITFDDILGTSAAMHEAISLARRYAATSENVLITGESGTGKEYFAQAIHNASRPTGSFMSVNCAAIPPRLIESELFGYESGAFTGADKAGKPGKIELADGGTLFLDEIGDMPLELQATLLRVLENKSVMRLGGKAYRKVDFRVVAATNRSLAKMVEDGLFREDLLYRLSILTVTLPPLRIREGDILFFAYYYLNECRRKSHEGPVRFTPAVEKLLREYPWPGNVRQIKNAIYSAFYAAVSDEIDMADLPQYLRDGASGPFEDFEGLSYSARYTPNGVKVEEAKSQRGASEESALEPTGDEVVVKLPEEFLHMDSIEGAAIRLALMYAGGNVTQAAEMLQISKATLYRKIKEHKLR